MAAGLARLQKIKMYVIDDDDDVRAALIFLLNAQGHRCHGYASGSDFLATILTLDRGCVLLDYRLPGMDGLQVLAEIRRMKQAWPVIVMTGHGHNNMAARARDLGAIGLLRKPFDDGQLDGLLRVASEALLIAAGEGEVG